MLTRIRIDRLAVHARHGVLPQERTVGADFFVSLSAAVETDISALRDDDLGGTVSYAALCDSIRQEMLQPSALLEHVAYRIGRRLMAEQPRIVSLSLRIDKQMPPMGVLVDAVGVEIELSRGE